MSHSNASFQRVKSSKPKQDQASKKGAKLNKTKRGNASKHAWQAGE